METANKSTNFTPLIAEMFATSPGHFSHYPDTLLFFLPLGRLAFPSSFHEVFFKWQLLTKPKAEGLTTIKKVLDTEIVHFVECNTMVRKYLCNYSVRTCSTVVFFFSYTYLSSSYIPPQLLVPLQDLEFQILLNRKKSPQGFQDFTPSKNGPAYQNS